MPDSGVPVSSVRVERTTSCSKTGMASRARVPMSEGSVGSSRQPSTSRPSSTAIASMPAFSCARSSSSTGRKAVPMAYWPTGGREKGSTARRKVSGICVMMPAPSPVPASEPTAPRCSRLRRASSAAWMMSWPAVPRRVATIARPHASCSRAGSYSPCATGTAEKRCIGDVSSIRTVLTLLREPCGTSLARGVDARAEGAADAGSSVVAILNHRPRRSVSVAVDVTASRRTRLWRRSNRLHRRRREPHCPRRRSRCRRLRSLPQPRATTPVRRRTARARGPCAGATAR